VFHRVLLLLVGLPAALAAQLSETQVKAGAERLTPALTALRHDLHEHPELSNRETRTAGVVARELTRLGLEVRTGIARTGVIGILRGGRPGPVVGVRADMDALPVTEETDVPYRSTVKTSYQGGEVGVSHVCGHDVHVTIALGVAEILAGARRQLPGTVVFIFQPAEEGPPAGEEGGARLMIQEGALRDPHPDLILALHTNGVPPEEAGDNEWVGKAIYSIGPAFAAAERWRARVVGRQAHGAAPHLGIDAAVTASQIVLALQTIRSRTLSPFSANVVTVGIMRGGDRGNIIPGEMYLEGTIRSFDDSTQSLIETRMREIFDGITRSAGASFTLDFDVADPVTVNDTALAARFGPVLARVLGAENVHVVPPITGGEDFAFFARAVPSFYFRIGVVAPGHVSGGHHTPTFRADDEAIPVGVRAMTTLVLEALRAPGS
jgi:amidohydrolase